MHLQVWNILHTDRMQPGPAAFYLLFRVMSRYELKPTCDSNFQQFECKLGYGIWPLLVTFTVINVVILKPVSIDTTPRNLPQPMKTFSTQARCFLKRKLPDKFMPFKFGVYLTTVHLQHGKSSNTWSSSSSNSPWFPTPTSSVSTCSSGIEYTDSSVLCWTKCIWFKSFL